MKMFNRFARLTRRVLKSLVEVVTHPFRRVPAKALKRSSKPVTRRLRNAFSFRHRLCIKREDGNEELEKYLKLTVITKFDPNSDTELVSHDTKAERNTRTLRVSTYKNIVKFGCRCPRTPFDRFTVSALVSCSCGKGGPAAEYLDEHHDNSRFKFVY